MRISDWSSDVCSSDLIGEYFERYFSARIDTLRQTGYWDALIRLAGRLPLAGRARLYAPLWGGIEDLTSLFLQLADGLERLGHAAEARAAIAALVPRDSSIIDVPTRPAERQGGKEGVGTCRSRGSP